MQFLRLLCLVVLSLLAFTTANARADPTAPSARAIHLTIASEGARPPYNYFNGDKLEGFELDLGRDLCRRMDADCTFVPQDWDNLIPGLIGRQYDAIMAAMEITPARQALIAFSTPYVRMPSAFLIRKDSDLAAATPAALAGRAIGVERGGPHDAYVAATDPAARLHRYATLSDAILDLEAGRVDAALGDKDAIVTFLQTRRDAACCRILADVPRVPAFFGDGIGIGLRKGDNSLRAAFDRALAACVADGTFRAISARYFSFAIN